ncbi:MAG: transposase [Cytophagaceae bacterium]|nr:transposase [Cytophagaceae bacterium]
MWKPYRNMLKSYPDSYQRERTEHFSVSSSCILYALRRLRISKKTLFASKGRCKQKS